MASKSNISHTWEQWFKDTAQLNLGQPRKRTITDADTDSDIPIAALRAKKQKQPEPEIQDPKSRIIDTMFQAFKAGNFDSVSDNQISLADRILRVQKRPSEQIAHNEVNVDPKTAPEEAGKLERITTAWNELARLESFNLTKNNDPTYKEYLAVKDFERMKRSKESPYEEFGAFQNFGKSKEKDPMYTEYVDYKSFSKTKRSSRYKEYLAFKEFESTKQKNEHFKQYLAVEDFKHRKLREPIYQEYHATRRFQADKSKNSAYQEYLTFKEFEKAKAAPDEQYKRFLKYQEFKATMDANPLIRKMRDIEHVQQLMEKSGKSAEVSKTG
ncbi:hypothetical protein HYALB_00007084 [Hymenoscyphus albidus]|uniref:Uncharacterized protein n=1 Tax=Hymenoscyphus albidus TaxID=595503 RepID=A0A9N9LKU1_9HELO|nr:hypothetical protein HYALB_00007084 [Hymenoscyphus albidus]